MSGRNGPVYGLKYPLPMFLRYANLQRAVHGRASDQEDIPLDIKECFRYFDLSHKLGAEETLLLCGKQFLRSWW